jgi:ribosomal protein S18 acetylase RimI-like enzyme
MDLWRRSGLSSLRPQGRDSREAFARQLESSVQTVLGLEKGAGQPRRSTEGQLIGVVVATHDGRKGWINRLAIDPDHRRQGHAKRLLAAAEEVLRAQGIHVIAALIESWNEASLAFFQHQGYQLDDNICYLSKRDSAKA